MHWALDFRTIIIWVPRLKVSWLRCSGCHPPLAKATLILMLFLFYRAIRADQDHAAEMRDLRKATPSNSSADHR